jgi:hypothetical protein
MPYKTMSVATTCDGDVWGVVVTLKFGKGVDDLT